MTSNASKIAATITPKQDVETEGTQSSTTALSLLREEEFLDKTVRVFGTPENPLFLARDVAEWIDYSKRPDGSYKMDVFLKNVDVKEKIKIFNPAYNKGGVLQINTEYWFLTEDGLYEVLMLSRKPKAKQFKSKVKEILKSVRMTGGYINPGQEDLFVETYLPFADENVKNFFRLNMQAMAQQNKIIKDQKLQLESQQKDLNEKDNHILIQNQKLSKQHEQLEFKDQQIEEYVNVVTDLVKDVPLAGKRAIINRVLRSPGDNFGARYMILYREFDNIYHMNTKFRMNKHNASHTPKCKSRLQYIDEQLGMLNELYELAVKLFKSDVEMLVQQMYDARL